jgi:hypothetical protein
LFFLTLFLLCCVVVKLNHTIQTASEKERNREKGGAVQYDVIAGS